MGAGQGMLAKSASTPSEFGWPEVSAPEPAFTQQAVGVTVASFELDDFVAAG